MTPKGGLRKEWEEYSRHANSLVQTLQDTGAAQTRSAMPAEGHGSSKKARQRQQQKTARAQEVRGAKNEWTGTGMILLDRALARKQNAKQQLQTLS